MTTAQLKRYWKRLGWSTAGSYCGEEDMQRHCNANRKNNETGEKSLVFFYAKK